MSKGVTLPRRDFNELREELKRTGKTHVLFVEGPSDLHFLPERVGEMDNVLIQSVSLFSIPEEKLGTFGMYGNNRALVVAASQAYADEDDCEVAGLIDLDCGVEEGIRSLSNVFITDFPAIESYACNPHTLKKFIFEILEMANVEEVLHDLPSELGPGLVGLYRYRKRWGNPLTEIHNSGNRKKEKGKENDTTRFLKLEATTVVLKVGALPKSPAGSLPSEYSWDTLQKECYGHDLASVIKVRFERDLRTNVAAMNHAAVERLLRAITLREHFFSGSVFERILEWSRGG